MGRFSKTTSFSKWCCYWGSTLCLSLSLTFSCLVFYFFTLTFLILFRALFFSYFPWSSPFLLGFVELASITTESSCYHWTLERNSVCWLMHDIDINISHKCRVKPQGRDIPKMSGPGMFPTPMGPTQHKAWGKPYHKPKHMEITIW